MTPPASIKPDDKPIKAYHAALEQYAAHGAVHEGATETAFSRLLADTARPHGWTLIPKKKMKAKATKKHIFPDGTLEDAYFLPRGFWEAKDLDDDLDAEIRNKIKSGYPLTNTIFEDTRQAVLYQNGTPTDVGVYDLTEPGEVADLLNDFYRHSEPDIDGFHQAVDEFQERVPLLARGLVEKIKEAHDKNVAFQAAFAKFFELCQHTLNPNIRREAVDEMLVQHLLTERVFRTIFHESDFNTRNVIAAEVERVIAALVSKSFSRDLFLKSLDKFYKAIEQAAEEIEDFQEKQHFLNTVYERFFQGYSVATADTHGIVYTPQPIVDFMCASVEEVLKAEFGLTLGSDGVNVLDPCTGTGNFVVNLLNRVPKQDLPKVYARQLFANEVMLLPYYIASLNIEHAYFERTGTYAPFEGLCFVDTLDLGKERHLFSERNADRVEAEKARAINVVIGNPPYNVGQLNENDNNKNRKYEEVDKRIKTTYVKDSQATLNTKVYDAYVRFFRWAADRLGKRDGIVCFVTNNSFLDMRSFDGMRKHLLQDFTKVYHLDLRGNVRHDPTLSGTQYNVFGIQVGVGITIAIRSQNRSQVGLHYYGLDRSTRRADKLAWLEKIKSLSGVKWKKLTPDDEHNWLRPGNADEFSSFLPLGSRDAKASDQPNPKTLCKTYSLGISTNRDAVVYDHDRVQLSARIERFIDDYNAEVDRYFRKGGNEDIDAFVKTDRVKWSRNLKRALAQRKYIEFVPSAIRHSQYRPYCHQWLYFAETVVDEEGTFRDQFPLETTSDENRVIGLSTPAHRSTFSCIASNQLANLNFVSIDAFQFFPFYVYAEDGTRTENITDWAMKQFRGQYKDKKLTKWDIFHYVYALLHHPGYRAKFADNLKKALPRIPFAPDFRAFAIAGKELAELHVGYEAVEPYPLDYVVADGKPLSYRVEKMALSKDKVRLVVNDSLTLAGIPPEVFAYRLGNRSALDWVIDQYRVSEDRRSGIVSDPNRADDAEYIVNLVRRVVRVSVETVRIVAALPEQFAPPATG